MKCPFCDFENPPGVTACGFCGAFLPSEEAETTKGDESILDRSAGRQIRCSYCWKINPATNEVCEECGMPLAYVPHPEQEGRSRKLLTRGQVWNPVPEGMVRCLGCWHDNPEGTILCEKCGVKLMKPAETPDYHLIKSQPSRPVVGYSSWYYAKDREQVDLAGDTISMMVKAARLDANEKRIAKDAEREKIERSKKRGSVNYAEPGKIRCRNCGYDNPADATACAQCGCKLRRSGGTQKTTGDESNNPNRNE